MKIHQSIFHLLSLTILITYQSHGMDLAQETRCDTIIPLDWFVEFDEFFYKNFSLYQISLEEENSKLTDEENKNYFENSNTILPIAKTNEPRKNQNKTVKKLKALNLYQRFTIQKKLYTTDEEKKILAEAQQLSDDLAFQYKHQKKPIQHKKRRKKQSDIDFFDNYCHWKLS